MLLFGEMISPRLKELLARCFPATFRLLQRNDIACHAMSDHVIAYHVISLGQTRN
jgi:hypothetical protein